MKWKKGQKVKWNFQRKKSSDWPAADVGALAEVIEDCDKNVVKIHWLDDSSHHQQDGEYSKVDFDLIIENEIEFLMAKIGY
jgi:hypothetical protein